MFVNIAVYEVFYWHSTARIPLVYCTSLLVSGQRFLLPIFNSKSSDQFIQPKFKFFLTSEFPFFFLFFLSRLSCGLNCSLTDKYLFKTDKDWCKYFLIKFTFLIDKTNKYWTLSLPFCLCCFKQVRTWRYLNIYNCNENEIFWQDRGAVWWNLCEEFVFGVVMMFDQ